MKDIDGSGVGTTIPPVVLPGKGAVIRGNSFGGKKASPSIKKDRNVRKRFTDVRNNIDTGISPQTNLRGPILTIKKHIPELSAKDVGSSIEATIKGKVISIMQDGNGIIYEVEVEQIGF